MGQATTFLRTPERMMALIRSMVFTGAGAVGDGAVAVQAGGDEAIRQTGRLGVRTVDIAPVGLRLTGGGVGDDVVDGPVVEAETEVSGTWTLAFLVSSTTMAPFAPATWRWLNRWVTVESWTLARTPEAKRIQAMAVSSTSCWWPRFHIIAETSAGGPNSQHIRSRSWLVWCISTPPPACARSSARYRDRNTTRGGFRAPTIRAGSGRAAAAIP